MVEMALTLTRKSSHRCYLRRPRLLAVVLRSKKSDPNADVMNGSWKSLRDATANCFFFVRKRKPERSYGSAPSTKWRAFALARTNVDLRQTTGTLAAARRPSLPLFPRRNACGFSLT
jgi:hypothetical protein